MRNDPASQANENPTRRCFGKPAGKLVVADFNRDGKLDLAIAPSDEITGLAVLLGRRDYVLGNRDGTFQQEVSFAHQTGPFITADFNGDGSF
jgi:hypothetical protein